MDVPTRVLFYNAYLFSLLTYCCCVWGKASNTSVDRLFKLQKRIARSIFDKPYDHPHSDLFKKLNWLEFQNLVDYRISLMVYKSLKNIAPNQLTNLFTYVEPGKHLLRSSKFIRLNIPTYRTTLYENSFSVHGAKLYNTLLSNDIHIGYSYSTFKEKVFNHMNN